MAHAGVDVLIPVLSIPVAVRLGVLEPGALRLNA